MKRASQTDPRIICFGVLAALTLTILPTTAARGQDEVPINSLRINERVMVTWACDHFQGTNMAVLVSREGLVLVDTGLSPTTVRRQRELIERELGRSDFRYIINTHVHNDHAFGNEVFPEASVVAPEIAVAAMQREVERIPELIARLRGSQASYHEWAAGTTPDSEEGMRAREGVAAFQVGIADLEEGLRPHHPTVTFSDRHTLDLGDLRLELFAFSGLHSEADILILAPEEKILFTGDVFRGGWIPTLRENVAGNLPGLLNNWRAILESCPDLETIVTGHSDIDLSVSQFRAMQEYLSGLLRDARAARKAGTALEPFLMNWSLEERYPEVAKLNYLYGELNFHQHNVYIMWQLAGR
jgi:glyoxylase-like metal-dependent hydrolase (beta-lactamase superfamily II)